MRPMDGRVGLLSASERALYDVWYMVVGREAIGIGHLEVCFIVVAGGGLARF